MSKLSMFVKVAVGIVGAIAGGYAMHKSVSKHKHEVEDAESKSKVQSDDTAEIKNEPITKKEKAKIFVKNTWPVLSILCVAALASSKYRPLFNLNKCGWTKRNDNTTFTDEETYKFICRHSTLAERMDPRKMFEMSLWGHIMMLQPKDKWPVDLTDNHWNFYPDYINWFTRTKK